SYTHSCLGSSDIDVANIGVLGGKYKRGAGSVGRRETRRGNRKAAAGHLAAAEHPLLHYHRPGRCATGHPTEGSAPPAIVAASHQVTGFPTQSSPAGTDPIGKVDVDSRPKSAQHSRS